MDLSSWANIATVGGFLVIITGILLTYFGKIIQKSRREITNDKIAEILNATLFLFLILMAGTIVFLAPSEVSKIFGSNSPSMQLTYLFYFLLFFIQFFLFLFYISKKFINIRMTLSKYLNKEWEVIISSAITLFITYYLISTGSYLFSLSSVILSFLILTYLASSYGVSSGGGNYKKVLEVEFIDKNKKPLKAKIKRLGDEFIDFLPEGEEDNEENKITINKSQIFSIKRKKSKK